MARSLWLLALVVLFQGNLVRAHAIIEEHLTFSREVNDQRGIAYSLLILGYIAFFQGQDDTMRTLLEESQALHKQTGDLRWVAMDLTDIQVAEKLIISSCTVSTHLRSIYNKLGVTSRSAATRFAVEHHLV